MNSSRPASSMSPSFKLTVLILLVVSGLLVNWYHNFDRKLANISSRSTESPSFTSTSLHGEKIVEYLQMQHIAPNDPSIAMRLVELYLDEVTTLTGYLWMHLTNNQAAIRAAAAAEVTNLKVVLRYNKDTDNRLLLSELLGEAQATAYQLKDASATAHYLLATAPKGSTARVVSNAVYVGNEVLGRVAVKTNQWRKAATYLRRSGNVKGEPWSRDVGPDMRLARSLIIHGCRTDVIRFLSHCKTFWKIQGAAETLTGWQHTVAMGSIPGFGSPLSFTPAGLAF